MRETKFRAWDVTWKKMRQVDRLWWSDYGTMRIVVKSENPGTLSSYDDDLYQGQFELMQYTGLKDKNGKEIYEGDIVKTVGLYNDSEIVFFNGAFGLKNDTGMLPLFFYKDQCEVIGNIHENPELLGDIL